MDIWIRMPVLGGSALRSVRIVNMCEHGDLVYPQHSHFLRKRSSPCSFVDDESLLGLSGDE